MDCQRNKFNLPTDVSYLNCANIAPLMNHLAAFGEQAIRIRQQPYKINLEDWFTPVEDVKKEFSRLIEADDYKRIALIPSVSYGVASVVKNITFSKNDEVIVVGEQYPSNYYSWFEASKTFGFKIKIIKPAETIKNRGETWNNNIVKAINKNTKVVAIGNVHWADGTLFDLETISKAAKHYAAYLIIDGSQSVGALPFSVKKIKPDALLCVGYKWLLGPFALGLAYFGERFDNGSPLEENWINREQSNDFQKLAAYNPNYRPLASRYNMGECSNFHLLPVLKEALKQINRWGVHNIGKYCHAITAKTIDDLKDIGLGINNSYQAKHLFGIRINQESKLKAIQKQFIAQKIYVSIRGSQIRVSVNVFNTEDDLSRLYYCLKDNL